MHSKTWITFLLLICFSCNTQSNSAGTFSTNDKIQPQQIDDRNPYDKVISIPLPAGCKRITADSNSFSWWLRQVYLKKDKTVYLFNGAKKTNQLAQFAVLDISLGTQDLQQCADAVMRLRAEYLFTVKKFNEIVFTDNAGRPYHFTAPYNHKHFQTYLKTVFGMCGSASLSKQLKKVDIKEIQPGDVFIRGGFPGHAVIVMDVAINGAGKKFFLLAQSYMPAQDIHVLVNPLNEQLSPWYNAMETEKIYTPEYVFGKNELKGW